MNKVHPTSKYIQNTYPNKALYRLQKGERTKKNIKAVNLLYGIVADRMAHVVTYMDEYIPLSEFEKFV